MDDVFTRICDLEDPNSIFAADLFYHKNCFPNYIAKYNSEKLNQKTKITRISDIRDMINNENLEIDMKNNELKAFLEEEISDQFSIQFI